MLPYIFQRLEAGIIVLDQIGGRSARRTNALVWAHHFISDMVKMQDLAAVDQVRWAFLLSWAFSVVDAKLSSSSR